MRVFVSYSFVDSELHLLTLLFEKLRKQGHIVETSNLHIDSSWNSEYSINYKVLNAELFIGIITNNSDSINAVVSEWNTAKNNNVKNILLIENGVQIVDEDIEYYLFDRFNPELTINKLFQKEKSKKSGVDGALIGAGIIVGLAALISLLSSSDD